MNYISLFSSAGVGCYGFKATGFSCISTNELIERRMNVQRANKICADPDGYIVGDISKRETKKKLFDNVEKWNKNNNGEIDFIIATPPCQGISVANHKKKSDEIKRNSLVTESIKIVDKIKPRVFVFENVRGFLKTICTDIDNVDREIGVAIDKNLAREYNIYSKVINFKEYGSNSSRTRTLVIGTRKDILDLNPLMLFPDKKKEKTLYDVIGHLDSLKEMGSFDYKDPFHSFRIYSKHMLPWIKNTKYGESAFNNTKLEHKPHKVVDSKIILNKNKNGDKYKRCLWDRCAPCVHTRNDILASQSTIHPVDNRVFSIRELMLMMTIPKSFQWFIKDNINDNIHDLIKKHEINIRQSIGEAVPTEIFKSIAKKYKYFLKEKKLTKKEIINLIEDNKLHDVKKLISFLTQNIKLYSFHNLSKIAELSNSKRSSNAAYYTNRSVVFKTIKHLPAFQNKNVKILEPSVGVGNFLPDLINKYKDAKSVEIDVIDIDKNSIEIAKILIKKIKVPKHIKINFNIADFLLKEFKDIRYDLVVGNPPFGNIVKNKKLLMQYKQNSFNSSTRNIFSFFIEKSLEVGDYVSFIIPKSLLSSPEFEKTRMLLNTKKVISIYDYGEKAFHGVKIETITITVLNKKMKEIDQIIIESDITNTTFKKKQSYILDPELPIWLLYRNNKFDSIYKKLKVGIFSYFRDRQITKKDISHTGKYKLIKSRNLPIKDKKINTVEEVFIKDVTKYIVKKYINKKCIVVPNLSYYPRAMFLPKNTVPDGSLAIFETDENITNKDIDYFKSEEFTEYYRIVQNYGTRSLNINKNTTFFWGIKR